MLNSNNEIKELLKKGQIEEIDTEERQLSDLVKNSKADNRLKQLYSWFLYYRYIQNVDFSKGVPIAKVDEIVELSNSKYSAHKVTILKLLKYLKGVEEWGKMELWLKKLDPKQLSDERWKDSTGKEYPSDKERYYSYKSKVLFKTQNYSDCIVLCEEALKEIKFSPLSKNDLWIKRWMALSKSKIGLHDESIKINLDILNADKYFIYKELGDEYAITNNQKSALKYYSLALLSKDGQIEKKGSVLKKLLNLLTNRDELELVIKLLIKIQKKNDLFIDDSLVVRAKEIGFDVDSGESIQNLDSLLCQKLVLYTYGGPMFSGEITNVLGEGHSGFIKSSEKSYYFNKNDFIDRRHIPKIGEKVNFYLEKRFNAKKNSMDDSAVAICINN